MYLGLKIDYTDIINGNTKPKAFILIACLFCEGLMRAMALGTTTKYM